ncbi:MAG: hypothetical protein PHY40_00570 [Patescibacteria group bacterium]|nr:hypothetical protein [Patescibacteria group bacterium]
MDEKVSEKMLPLEIKEKIVESVNIIKKEICKEYIRGYLKKYLTFYADRIKEGSLEKEGRCILLEKVGRYILNSAFDSSDFGHISVLWDIMYLCPEEGEKIMEEFLKEEIASFERLSKDIENISGFFRGGASNPRSQEKDVKDVLEKKLRDYLWYYSKYEEPGIFGIPVLFLKKFISCKKFFFSRENRENIEKNTKQELSSLVPGRHKELEYYNTPEHPEAESNVAQGLHDIKKIMFFGLIENYSASEEQIMSSVEKLEKMIKLKNKYKEEHMLSECILSELVAENREHLRKILETSHKSITIKEEEEYASNYIKIKKNEIACAISLEPEYRGLISAGCILKKLNSELPKNLMGIFIDEAEAVIKKIKESEREIEKMEKIHVDVLNPQLSATYVVVEGTRNKYLGNFLKLVPVVADLKRIFC